MSNEPIEQFQSEGDLNLSARRSAWQAEHLDEATRRLLAEDSRYFLRQSLSTPCLNVLEGCHGAYIEDTQGRKFLDFHGNNVHQVGFSHPKVLAAISDQLSRLPFCTRRYTNRPAIDLARKLTELTGPGLDKVLFAPGGTSAIGMAMKLARVATGRFKTISMWDSFHGASLDAISIGGEAVFRHGAGPLLAGCEHVPPSDPLHCPWDCAGTCSLKCADYIEYVLEKEGDVGAVIGETVRSTPFIPPPDYWRRIRQACDRHGALLILDEIPHCLGRTGRMFACEHYEVVPDMLVIGKGLGGGVFPLAALIANGDLDVAAERALGHYTHEKNPVAAAAALATIDVIESENLLEHARAVGTAALVRMNEMKKRWPVIGDVRGLGLMMGIELVRDRESMARDCPRAERVMYHCLANGLNFKVSMGNILTLTPSLTISLEEMDQALATVEQALAATEPVGPNPVSP